MPIVSTTERNFDVQIHLGANHKSCPYDEGYNFPVYLLKHNISRESTKISIFGFILYAAELITIKSFKLRIYV